MGLMAYKYVQDHKPEGMKYVKSLYQEHDGSHVQDLESDHVIYVQGPAYQSIQYVQGTVL